MFQALTGIGIGALIAAIFDNGDAKTQKVKVSLKDKLSMADRASVRIAIEDRMGGSVLSGGEVDRMVNNIISKNPDTNQAIQEADRVGRILYKNSQSSAAELREVTSKYDLSNQIDDTVSEKEVRIYDSIDPSDDADTELGDSFSFETEIENIFGVEQMAPSEEDIASETDIQDYSITDPIDEISQEREVNVSDDTISPEDEISAIEETTPFEEVIYPDEDDLDLDKTDDFDELLQPLDEYRQEEAIEDQIQASEQELDEFSDEIENNIFQSAAWTFDQDMSQETLTTDETYQDVGENMNVIDFENYYDDVVASPLDLISDHMGDTFFQWMDTPFSESLDVNPFG